MGVMPRNRAVVYSSVTVAGSTQTATSHHTLGNIVAGNCCLVPLKLERRVKASNVMRRKNIYP